MGRDSLGHRTIVDLFINLRGPVRYETPRISSGRPIIGYFPSTFLDMMNRASIFEQSPPIFRYILAERSVNKITLQLPQKIRDELLRVNTVLLTAQFGATVLARSNIAVILEGSNPLDSDEASDSTLCTGISHITRK